MSGTIAGGQKCAATNKRLYGEDYYVKLAALGGKKSTAGGFGQGEKGRELARIAGAEGGRVSRRRKWTEAEREAAQSRRQHWWAR